MLLGGDVLDDVLGPPEHLLDEVVRGLDGLVRSFRQALADLIVILLDNGCSQNVFTFFLIKKNLNHN